MCMVQEPVQHGAGERGIAVERFLPVPEGQIGLPENKRV